MANKFFSQDDIKDLEAKTSQYMDLEDGDNLIRIVSGFTKGYKFNFDNQELNKELNYPFYAADDENVAKYKGKLQKTFVMVVWDYASESFKILKVHQKTILSQINTYMENDKYGDPTKYDLIINKSSVGKTKYTVTANPPEAVSKKIEAELAKVEIKPENIFVDGEDVIIVK